MADGIFTEDELKAEQQGPGEIPPPEGETEEQKAERERDEQGRFKAKEPDAEPRKDGDPPEVNDKGGTVPQQALHAEREKRKAAEAELKPLKEQLEALAEMRKQVASRKPADLPAADDPAALEHLRTRLTEIEQGQTRITQHMDTQAINEAELQQLGSVMAKSEESYRAENPDYDEAINHVVQARACELSLYGLKPHEIHQTISEEATEIVRSAVAQGRDPAELGYQIALSRGYHPKVVADGNGPINEPGKTAAQATLDAIAVAKQSGKSLGSASGTTPKQLNAEAVLKMTPEEFDAVYSTPEGRAMIDNL